MERKSGRRLGRQLPLAQCDSIQSDTPNLVTDIVRTQGVAGNWIWWAFVMRGMGTVFIYAKLWRGYTKPRNR